MTDRQADAAALAAIVLSIGLVVLLVPPRGEFPIGDDWDYAATAFDVVKHRELRLSDFPAMTLVFHVLYGGAFVAVLGPTYWALRIASLVALTAGAIGVYLFSRELRLKPAWAAFIALHFALNPLVLSLAYTFHTNVTGAALMAWSLACQARAVRTASFGWYLAAGIVGACAYLTRQTAAVPTLLFLAALIPYGFGTKLRTRDFLGAWVPFVLLVGVYYAWLFQVHGQPYFQRLVSLTAAHWLDPARAARRLLNVLLPTALFFAPLAWPLLVATWHHRRVNRRGVIAAALILSAAALLAFLSGRGPLPYSGAEHFDCGVGNDFSLPHLRTGLLGPGLAVMGQWISLHAVAATLLAWSSLGAIALVAASCASAARRLPRPPLVAPVPVVAVSLAASLFIVLSVESLFEWYLIPVIQLSAVLLAFATARLAPSGPGVVGPILLAAYAAFGVASVQDCLARNANLWDAIYTLHESGLGPDQINGGFEYSGAFRFEPVYRTQRERVRPYLAEMPPLARAALIAKLSPWSDRVPERRITLCSIPLDGCRILRAFPYRSWLRTAALYVLEEPRDSERSSTDAPSARSNLGSTPTPAGR